MAPRKKSTAAAKPAPASGQSRSGSGSNQLPREATVHSNGRVTFADGASGKNVAAVEAFPRPRDSYGGSILSNGTPRPNLPRRLPDPKESPWIAAYPPDTVDADEYWKLSPPPSPNPSHAEPFDPSKLQFSLKDFKFAEPVHDDPDTLMPFLMRCMWLEEDMRRERRRHRQPIVVKYRFQLGLPASVPRPKLPVNQAFRDWIGPLAPAKETTYGQTYMPTNYMPEQDFDTEEDFLAAMDDFIIAAQKWMLLRQDEALRVKLAITADSSDQPGRPQDVLAGIAPIVVDPAVYAADPTAPPFFRHHRWWTFTHFPLPPNPALPRTSKPRRAVILSNVNYIPRPPPTGFRRTCIDRRHGHQEESRYPQWHAQGRWHMPFIPTDNYGGVQYHVNRSANYPGLMEYYEVKLPHYFITSDNIHFSPGRELRIAMTARWDTATGRLTTLPRAYAMQRPMHAQEVGQSALVHLFNHALPERRVKETMASWQRSVAELDGYWVYCQCRIELQKESDKYNGKLQMAADCRLGFPTRLPARGVYTTDPRVAALYAQFGVPVWLVVTEDYEFWTAGGQADEIEMMAPFHCETRYYSDADAPRHLAHLARAQEYQKSVPVNEEDDYDRDDDREYRDYQDPSDYENDDVVMQDDGPSYDNDVPMHESEPVPAVAALPERPLLEGMGQTKRKAAGPAEGSGTKAKKNKVSALGVPSYPQIRHLPEDQMPPWWPKRWPVAFNAVTETQVVIRERVKTLRADPTHPIPNSRFGGGHYATPTIEPFAAEMHKNAVPSTTSSIFARYAQLRATLLATLAGTPLVDLNTFRPKNWKEILNGQLKEHNQALVAKRLGFDLDAPPAIVEDDPGSHDDIALDLAAVLDLTPLPPTNAPAPSTSTAQSLPVELGGPRTYFEPLDTPLVPRLQIEEERYLAEPPGWRFTARGHARSLKSFVWWVEEDSPADDGVLEFVIAGKAKRADDDVRNSDAPKFWDYENAWVFVLNGEPTDNEGPISGERLMKPFRLFRWAGSKSKASYLYSTSLNKFRQSRVWRAQRLQDPLYVPVAPFGAVGCRSARACLKEWTLTDADYAHFFPNAPRPPPMGANGKREFVLPDIPELPDKAPASMPLVSASADASGSKEASSSTSSQGPNPPAGPGARLGKKPLNALLEPQRVMFFNGIQLSDYDLPPGDNRYRWPADAERAMIAWDVAELSFRLELAQFDDMLRLLHKDDPKLHNPKSNLDREKMVCAVWGSETFVPNSQSLLTTSEWTLRIDRILAFHALVSTWPRTELPPLPEGNVFPSEVEFLVFERSVWDAYARTLELAQFDDMLRLLHKDDPKLHNPKSNLDREKMVCAVWGSETFVPNSQSLLTTSEWTLRIDRILAFHALVSTWPRTELPPLPEGNVFPSEVEFLVFERSVWDAYARTYADYMYRQAQVPLLLPDDSFFESAAPPVVPGESSARE
ncbi:hypothetical protein AURDEDRAFT_166962 [Auricularia subglabra TFB-10046 SS5]|nr:hypothetical protein AURDEDRAFT_166962 [Auricularia subglabra TFB-10046 SS5]